MTGTEKQPDAPLAQDAPPEPDAAPTAAGPGENAPAPAPETAPDPAAEPRRRRRVVAVAGSLLLAGAVVAGVAGTAVVVSGADRDAGAPVWTFPKAAEEEKPSSAEGLAGALVPYGTDGWLPGPDLGEYGSDARLSGARATALHKEALRGLPRSERRRMEKEIDRLRVRGMAMRSYVSGSASVYQEETIYTVSVLLTRMDNRSAVRNQDEFRRDFFGSLKVFRKGPEIKGHEDAACFLPPKSADRDLDAMFCSASVGDVLVTLVAEGAKPLDTKGVAGLLSRQLDRIDAPGVAV
ncbi:hypothetical protein ACLGIH_18060 [Streptomyces sp. HMX87]|uniref:hypothetical protein n=1 Tax=Streptomyces sp. HMX87 TaxID=3390849 RepID=UPI003A8465DD